MFLLSLLQWTLALFVAALATRETIGFNWNATDVLLWLTLSTLYTMRLMGNGACVALVTVFDTSPTDIATLIAMFTVELALVNIPLAFDTILILIGWQPKASNYHLLISSFFCSLT